MIFELSITQKVSVFQYMHIKLIFSNFLSIICIYFAKSGIAEFFN